MRLLAIDTTQPAGSIALAGNQAGDAELIVLPLPAELRTAESLLPEIDRLLEDGNLKLSEIDCLAVAAGPGSFTGLRLGVTTAKTLAYATGADVIGVGTLDAWALGQTYPSRLWAVYDAGRGQQVAACYKQGRGPVTAEIPKPLAAPKLWATDAWQHQLRSGDCVCGPLVERLRPTLPPGVTIQMISEPLAGNVARLANLLHRQGQTSDPMTLVPDYYRPSAAEEKLGA